MNIQEAWVMMEKLTKAGCRATIGWNGFAWDVCADVTLNYDAVDDWISDVDPANAILKAYERHKENDQ